MVMSTTLFLLSCLVWYHHLRFLGQLNSDLRKLAVDMGSSIRSISRSCSHLFIQFLSLVSTSS
ncbi:hypothetical protein M405DRAFT_270255 [Rhizopogon salebrosus TDB-379]|nr:hypothetical protein M405DRAFT_270255 [Rhizopogon salebrosus TDB-379]